MDFNAIYFHDSKLNDEIKYDWSSSTLSFALSIFIDGPRRPTREFILKFNKCSFFEVSHHAPWGDSIYVTHAEQIGNDSEGRERYEIVIGSGDIIKISAMGFELIEKI